MNTIANLAEYFARHPLTRRAPYRAWARFIAWQVRSRFQDDVVLPWISGQRLVVRRGMTGATGNVYAGLHEFADMILLLHFLRAGDLFLDIGANVGSYTVLASGVCRARTWAFEPDPNTAAALQRNLTINSLGGIVTIHEVALGDADGEVAFTIGHDTMNRVATMSEGGVRTVRQRRLDDVVGDMAPIMLKIDVEGYEHAVLLGARQLLSRGCVEVVEIETLTPQIEGLLADGGLTRVWYDPFTRELLDKPRAVPASNAVFVRDRKLVSERLKSAKAVEVLGQSI